MTMLIMLSLAVHNVATMTSAKTTPTKYTEENFPLATLKKQMKQ